MLASFIVLVFCLITQNFRTPEPQNLRIKRLEIICSYCIYIYIYIYYIHPSILLGHSCIQSNLTPTLLFDFLLRLYNQPSFRTFIIQFNSIHFTSIIQFNHFVRTHTHTQPLSIKTITTYQYIDISPYQTSFCIPTVSTLFYLRKQIIFQDRAQFDTNRR